MKKLTFKLLSVFVVVIMMFCIVGCDDKENNSSNSSSSETSISSSGNTISKVDIPENEKPTIYLAGDSTVKTYGDNEFMAGWGQYLSNYLKDEVKVVNKSNGGRSSRSFINEGRLFTNSEITESYTSIESEIKAGDYLMIQFGHNDDYTGGGFVNYVDRKVPVGTADTNGIYPTVVPENKVSTSELPAPYIEYCNTLNTAEKTKTDALNVIKEYGSSYYSFDCGGTFKGYLKMYIDFARERNVIPILCTPVTRVSFNSAGTEIIGAVNKHGANLEYVEAVRQLANEEKCLLIDTYDYTKKFMEAVGKAQSDLLMALKTDNAHKTTALIFTEGEWQTAFDIKYNAYKTGVTVEEKLYINGIEGTHYNKFGANITAGAIAEAFLNLNEAKTEPTAGEKINFAVNILTTSKTLVKPSSKLTADNITALKGVLKKITF